MRCRRRLGFVCASFVSMCERIFAAQAGNRMFFFVPRLGIRETSPHSFFPSLILYSLSLSLLFSLSHPFALSLSLSLSFLALCLFCARSRTGICYQLYVYVSFFAPKYRRQHESVRKSRARAPRETEILSVSVRWRQLCCHFCRFPTKSGLFYFIYIIICVGPTTANQHIRAKSMKHCYKSEKVKSIGIDGTDNNLNTMPSVHTNNEQASHTHTYSHIYTQRSDDANAKRPPHTANTKHDTKTKNDEFISRQRQREREQCNECEKKIYPWIRIHKQQPPPF